MTMMMKKKKRKKKEKTKKGIEPRVAAVHASHVHSTAYIR